MQFEKTDKICCVVLRFRIYILLLTTYARLLCILLKSLSIVILEFDDKFSQSSRFCWGSNFSLSLNLEPQSYLVPDFKNKIDLSPDISGIARYLSPPFCRGSFGGYTEGFFVYGSGLEIISRSRWGIFWTTKEMTMSWDSWLKSIQLSFCPLSENDELFLHSPPLFFSDTLIINN